MTGNVDAANAQARVAEECLDAPAVGELDRGTLPARRLELRETCEVVGRNAAIATPSPINAGQRPTL